MSLSIDESVESYTITFRREIIFYLRQLINDGDQVSISFNEGQDTLLTVLLDVDDERGLLYFDWGSSDETNRRLLKSERNFFVANPQGVRNQFMTGAPRETSYENRRAFVVSLPERYVRLQRREFFRLVLPITQRAPCTLPHPEGGQAMVLEIVDIGIGGIGLNIPKLDFPLQYGQVIEKARIALKGQPPFDLPLEIRHVISITKGTKVLEHVGCAFVKLSASQENVIQKFMSNIQREERAKLGG